MGIYRADGATPICVHKAMQYYLQCDIPYLFYERHFQALMMTTQQYYVVFVLGKLNKKASSILSTDKIKSQSV